MKNIFYIWFVTVVTPFQLGLTKVELKNKYKFDFLSLIDERLKWLQKKKKLKNSLFFQCVSFFLNLKILKLKKE